MSRKLTAATLALTLAGGVYLTAGSVQASNMGFKLERSFAVVREDPTTPATSFQNIYLLSFPLFNGLGDVGSTAAGGDKCAAGPDTIVDSTDAICDLFTDRANPANRGNSFGFQRFNRDNCLFESQIATVGFAGLNFGGPAFLLERDSGFWITVNGTTVPPSANRAVVVGSHDPSYLGRQVREPASGCAPKNDLLNLPYHSMYQKANEILCGLEGVDWVDGNADGNPDTCTRGIFDGTRTISVGTFDNINDDSLITGDNAFTFRIVSFSFMQVRFTGPNFDLIPGDAYIASISPLHVPTTFISPHF